jgi:hypothetical protein
MIGFNLKIFDKGILCHRIVYQLVMWYNAIYLGRAALKEPESNGSQIRI